MSSMLFIALPCLPSRSSFPFQLCLFQLDKLVAKYSRDFYLINLSLSAVCLKFFFRFSFPLFLLLALAFNFWSVTYITRHGK